MPNKTIYVSDGDLPLYTKAQEIAGGNLSQAISAALRRYVDVAEATNEGFEEITVRVGVGAGRKQRFVGILLARWGRSTMDRVERFHVYRSRTGKFVVHIQRSADHIQGSAERGPATGWRRWVGDWSSNQIWGFAQGDATLQIVDSLDELRPLIPSELYDMVVTLADEPTVEDLDI